MQEIVKYKNEFNTLNLTGFDAADLDLLMLLCAKMKEKETAKIVIDFQELKKKLGMVRKTNKDFYNLVDRMGVKLNAVNCHFKTETESVRFVLFPTLAVNLETRTLTVKVNEDFAFLLNDLTKNFTRFELSEFVRLESKYSKNLYRLLKQYRKTGTYIVEVERFRQLMDCPHSYGNKVFMHDCVNKAVKELSQGYFDNLKVEPLRDSGRGRPIVAYEFTFKPSKDIPGQMKFDVEPHQDPGNRAKPKPRKTRFHNLEERDYITDSDKMADLERQLLRQGTKQTDI